MRHMGAAGRHPIPNKVGELTRAPFDTRMACDMGFKQVVCELVTVAYGTLWQPPKQLIHKELPTSPRLYSCMNLLTLYIYSTSIFIIPLRHLRAHHMPAGAAIFRHAALLGI